VRPSRPHRRQYRHLDFALSASDMAAIDALDRAERGGLDPDVFDIAVLEAGLKK
jgi:hypothetical protein